MPQPSSDFKWYHSPHFDDWSGHYDDSVSGEDFPFTGYRRVLAETVRLADAHPGISVLELGTGTGNLAELLGPTGCELWCTDFSREMLGRAQEKLPDVHFLLHDLRQPFPLTRRFDRILSAYVFHHFELPEKVAIIQRLLDEQLSPGGILLIADISFPTWQALEVVRQAAGEFWDEEPYWIAADALPVLQGIGAAASYRQISHCTGIYQLTKTAA